MTLNHPITICGAGISGLTAAVILASKGYDVEILEKRNSIGAGSKGDFQGLENWTSSKDILDFLSEINIPVNFKYEPFKECLYYDENLKKYPLKSEKVGFYLIRRGPMEGSLDSCLAEAARNLGVKIKFKSPGLPQDADIIATGSKYPLLIATGINFETDLEKIAIGLFDDNVAPSGYAYLVGFNGYATLAVVSTIVNSNLSQFLNKAIDRFRKILNFQITNPHKFGGQGTCFTGISNGVPVIGEAGGFQDAMWGFGLRMAFHSGYLAATAISEKFDYWEMVQRKIIPYCRSSVVNRWIYDIFKSYKYKFFLNKFVNAKDPVLFANKIYLPTKLKDIVFPIANYFVVRKHFRNQKKNKFI